MKFGDIYRSVAKRYQLQRIQLALLPLPLLLYMNLLNGMEIQTDFATWFFYALSGLLALALSTIIWKYLNKLDETIKEFKKEMTAFQITQAVHHERISRVERWDVDMITEIVEKAVEASRRKAKG